VDEAPPEAPSGVPAVSNGAVPADPAAPAPEPPAPTAANPEGLDAAPAPRPSLVITVKPATPVPEPPPTPTVRVTAPAVTTGPVQPPVLVAQSVHVDVGDRTRPRATAVTALHVRLAAATEPPSANGAADDAPAEPPAGWATVLTLACGPRCAIERVTVAALPPQGAPATEAINAPVTATFYHRYIAKESLAASSYRWH